MSKRQAPDSDQQDQHGRNGKLRKRGQNIPSADENVEIIDVEDGEEEEDWFNMTMSKHTHTWQDDSQSSRRRTYSARSARAERRKNLQDQQTELIADEELFDTQLQKALALSKQEAEKSTFQQQAEEEELQKILERSRVEMGTPVRAAQVETAEDVFLSPGAPLSPVQMEAVTPVKPAQVKTGAPVKPSQEETAAGAKPAQVKTAAPAKLAQVETAAIAPARVTQVETGSPVRGTQVEETGAPVKQTKPKTNGKTCKEKATVETAESAPVRRDKKVETAAGAAVRRAELENGTPAKPSQSKAGAASSPRCNSHRHVEAHRTTKQLQGKAEEVTINVKDENINLQPAKVADLPHVGYPAIGSREKEKVKKHQAKVKRRRQISLDYMESGTGERWMKKRRVVYHHGNFVRRPGVDTAKQTKYIIKCLENYRLRLYQAQRQQLSKLDWGKPLEAEDDTKPRSRRRKGTWTAVSQEEDADSSQPADQDTQNGALATLDKDNKDGTIDLGTFEFDNDTQNGTVSSAVESQGQTCDNVIEPAENAANTEKMEKLEMPDSTSFDIDILDLPSPEHKPLTRSQSRETSSPVVMDTPDQTESLETEEETQVSILPDKTADERTGPSEHEQEDITIPESQEHTIQDDDDQSTRRTLRPRSTKQLKITDVVLTDESEKSDNDVEDGGDFLQRIQRRLNLKRKPLHRQGRSTAPVLKQGRIDHAVRNGTTAGSTSTSRTEPSRNERVMQSCFICGKEVPEDELQEHINNELDNSS
ncbi:hypothetical protein Bbelb_088760 [Branchiostoma belcheri]|nr:hypothetical protein Bbelb_088760 [Branchiostoma belcheri]